MNEHKPSESSSGSFPNTASPWKRLLAAIVDLFIVDFFATPLLYKFNLEAIADNPFNVSTEIAVKVLLCMVVVFFLLNGVMLARRGQTIGKWLLKIAIVRVDDQPAHIINLVLNRYLIQLVMVFVPLLNMIDMLFMFFRKDRRCLHDFTAKTKVIDVRVKSKANPNSIIA